MKFAITREGIYYSFVVLVILIGSILREVNPLLLFAAFLCAPLVIAWRMGRKSLKDIRIRRRMPNQVFAGEPFIVYLEAINPRKNSIWSLSAWGVVVIDRIRPMQKIDDTTRSGSERPYEPAVYFEFLPNGETVRKSYAGRLPERGTYQIGPVLVSTRFPFGFFRHWFEQADSQGGKTQFYVYPRLGRLSRNWRTRHHEAVETRHRKQFQSSRISGEFLGVRRWQSGDARKWIHWRASAKHREPFVRQFEKNRNRNCAILLDLFQTPAGQDANEGRENFELAISFAATLVSETARQGGCDLFFATSQSADDYLGGPICHSLVESIFRRLALAENDTEDQLANLMIKTLALTDPSADMILITSETWNLSTSPRFDSIRNDPRFRVLLQRVRLIDTSNPNLDQFFSLVEEKNPT